MKLTNNAPKELRDLCEQIWSYDVSKRPKMQTIADVIATICKW